MPPKPAGFHGFDKDKDKSIDDAPSGKRPRRAGPGESDELSEAFMQMTQSSGGGIPGDGSQQ